MLFLITIKKPVNGFYSASVFPGLIAQRIAAYSKHLVSFLLSCFSPRVTADLPRCSFSPGEIDGSGCVRSLHLARIVPHRNVPFAAFPFFPFENAGARRNDSERIKEIRSRIRSVRKNLENNSKTVLSFFFSFDFFSSLDF